MNKIKLEELLKTKVDFIQSDGKKIKITPRFIVSVQGETSEGVRIIVHPFGHSGETLDFLVSGNELRQ